MTDSFDIRNCFASLSPSGQHPLRGAGCLLSLCSPAGCLRQAISAALRFAVLGSTFNIAPVRRALIEADREMPSDEMRTTNRVFPHFVLHHSSFKLCPASLPGQLFYSTQIPVCLWFIEKNGNASAKHAAFKTAQTQNNAAMAKAHSNFQLT